jgi:hypothetical protein
MGFRMSAVQKKLGLKALADQSALHVDKGHQNRINLFGGDGSV